VEKITIDPDPRGNKRIGCDSRLVHTAGIFGDLDLSYCSCLEVEMETEVEVGVNVDEDVEGAKGQGRSESKWSTGMGGSTGRGAL